MLSLLDSKALRTESCSPAARVAPEAMDHGVRAPDGTTDAGAHERTTGTGVPHKVYISDARATPSVLRAASEGNWTSV